MLYIGNDIVDLREEDVVRKQHDKSFVRRVFSAKEQAMIKSSTSPNLTLWTIWAAKESAYKIISKHKPHVIFSHSSFCVGEFKKNEYGNTTAEVTYKGLSVRVVIHRIDQSIHVVGAMGEGAEENGCECYSGEYKLEDDFTHHPDDLRLSFFNEEEKRSIHSLESAWVRYHAKLALAEKLGANFSCLAIVRHFHNRKWMPPFVYGNGAKMNVDISLSHHGKWVAWAFGFPKLFSESGLLTRVCHCRGAEPSRPSQSRECFDRNDNSHLILETINQVRKCEQI